VDDIKAQLGLPQVDAENSHTQRRDRPPPAPVIRRFDRSPPVAVIGAWL
jgi:hypothetical protein